MDAAMAAMDAAMAVIPWADMATASSPPSSQSSCLPSYPFLITATMTMAMENMAMAVTMDTTMDVAMDMMATAMTMASMGTDMENMMTSIMANMMANMTANMMTRKIMPPSMTPRRIMGRTTSPNTHAVLNHKTQVRSHVSGMPGQSDHPHG